MQQLFEASKIAKELSLGNTEVLIELLNGLNSSEREKLFHNYNKKRTGKVNSIRKQVAESLLHEDITQAHFSQIYNAREKATPYPNLLSYFYPFLNLKYKTAINDHKRFIHQLINDLGLKDIAKCIIYNFEGPRQTGQNRSWTAIIHKSHPKQTTAKQLHLHINDGILYSSVYSHQAKKHEHELVLEANAYSYKKVLDHFKPYTYLIKQDVKPNEPLAIALKG